VPAPPFRENCGIFLCCAAAPNCFERAHETKGKPQNGSIFYFVERG